MAANNENPGFRPIALNIKVIDRDRLLLVIGYPEFSMNLIVHPNSVRAMTEGLERARQEALSRLVNPGLKTGIPANDNGSHDKS